MSTSPANMSLSETLTLNPPRDTLIRCSRLRTKSVMRIVLYKAKLRRGPIDASVRKLETAVQKPSPFRKSFRPRTVLIVTPDCGYFSLRCRHLFFPLRYRDDGYHQQYALAISNKAGCRLTFSYMVAEFNFHVAARMLHTLSGVTSCRP